MDDSSLKEGTNTGSNTLGGSIGSMRGTNTRSNTLEGLIGSMRRDQ